MPKILIAGTSYVPDETARELCKLSCRVIKTLNPDEDFVLIDAGSPFDPRQFMPNGSGTFYRFSENVGSITQGGKDGSGRGLCKAVEMGIEGDYDYVAIHETDMVFAKPIRPIIERMHKSGVKVASPSLASPYIFAEWSIFFINCHYAKEIDFIGQYDWEHTERWPLVEMKLEKMFGDDLFFLGLRGLRNEGNQINVANIANHFPYVMPSWMTHCADHNVYARMLELNGVYPK
jgi:hypothetical protein